LQQGLIYFQEIEMLRNRTVEAALEAVQALDLDSVKTRIMDPLVGEGWTREYADSVEGAYRTYLTMVIKYPEDAANILLSKDVDEFWHTHILQTMKYVEDCGNIFGEYFHHQPHVGELTAADQEKREAQAERTRQLYEREFEDADVAWSGALMQQMPIHAETAAVSSATSAPKWLSAENAAVSSATSAPKWLSAENAASSATSVMTAG
jgi:hypothetical protein